MLYYIEFLGPLGESVGSAFAAHNYYLVEWVADSSQNFVTETFVKNSTPVSGKLLPAVDASSSDQEFLFVFRGAIQNLHRNVAASRLFC
jgi:hypothetical protein